MGRLRLPKRLPRESAAALKAKINFWLRFCILKQQVEKEKENVGGHVEKMLLGIALALSL